MLDITGVVTAFAWVTIHEDGEISIHDDRWLTYPWGVNGANPGWRSTKELVRATGETEMLPSKCDRFEVKSGDILYFNTWGGGGVGDPLTRETERVLKDVNSGLVGLEAANDIYGVVISNGAVDEAASEKLRAEKAANKTEAKLLTLAMNSKNFDPTALKKQVWSHLQHQTFQKAAWPLNNIKPTLSHERQCRFYIT